MRSHLSILSGSKLSFHKTGLHFESILALNCSEQEKPNTPAVNTNQETKCQLNFLFRLQKNGVFVANRNKTEQNGFAESAPVNFL